MPGMAQWEFCGLLVKQCLLTTQQPKDAYWLGKVLSKQTSFKRKAHFQ